MENSRARTAVSDSARIRGALLGGAIGDALGYPVEFDAADAIDRSFGLSGVRAFEPIEGKSGLVSDDTQMTLFTVEGIMRHLRGGRAVRDEVASSYVDWFATQVNPAPAPGASGLLGCTWLYSRRAPGMTVMGALAAALNEQGSIPDARNDSKGCGTVMRSAPFGLVREWSVVRAFREARLASALTHGHETAGISAGILAALLRGLLDSLDLEAALRSACDLAQTLDASSEVLLALESAMATARDRPSRGRLESLGGGWVAEEALAIAVYCVRCYPGRDQILQALSLAVSHSGDSDSTGAICGNILGALHGLDALPLELADGVEGRATIEALATEFAELVAQTSENIS